MGLLKDSYYVTQVLKGNVAAFAFLVDKHKDSIFNLAYRITGNREDAEEIAQDAFLKAFQKLDTFRKQAKFSTWLYRIAFNLAISKTRKKKTEITELNEKHFDQYILDDVRYEIMESDEEDVIKMLHHAMDELDTQELALTTLFYYEGKSIDDISEITGITPGNVKVRLHRTRKKLYAILHRIMSTQEVYPT
ncbi:MAG: RNA polymerase sigma factor [Bacteroidetes bacterium]|nr:RNA polymerase sigma factor [Bacteroidota bacterium]